MSNDVTLPALGESVTEGTVTRWLKAVGDTVAVDEPLVEVSTDKVDTEIPSPFAGVLTEILVPEDEVAPVGTVLARIGEPGESAAPAVPTPAVVEAPPAAMATPAAPLTPAWAPVESAAPAAPEPAPAAAPAGGGRDVTLPALGESVTEGTVTRWLKAVGDTVAVDEPLVEVSTDKVDTEIPSPFAGVLIDVLVAEDEVVAVGTVLARIGEPGAVAIATPAVAAPAVPEPAPTPAPAAPAPEPAVAAPVAPLPTAVPAAVPSGSAPVSTGSGYVTPIVRKLASERGVDLSRLAGTGVGGRIRKEDIIAAAEAAAAAAAAAVAAPAAAPSAPVASPAAPAAAPSVPAEVSELRGTTVKMTRLRTIIADRMMESLHGMAQLTTVIEVDVTKIAALRAKVKDPFRAREGANLTFLGFFTYAAAEALKAYPKLNARIDGDSVVYAGHENLALAVDTEKGLITPVMKNAGDISLADHARAIADLAARARDNKLTPDDMSGATFTVTNTGSIGAVFDTPIVPSPQVGILGTGVIQKRPMVVTGPDGTEAIAIRSMCYLALSYDHRIVDGADASRFLQAVKKRIEAGAFEAEVGL